MKTLVLIKPDAVENKFVGSILSAYEISNKILAIKCIKIDQALCRQHYAEHVEKDFYPKLEEFMTSDKLVAVAIEGDVKACRAICKCLRTAYDPDYAGGPR